MENFIFYFVFYYFKIIKMENFPSFCINLKHHPQKWDITKSQLLHNLIFLLCVLIK
jgi:hypothetical protein